MFAARYEENETVIGSWNIPKKSFHGYTKVVTTVWKSEVVQAGKFLMGSDGYG